MFDMSWGEVMMIGGVALIVIGPKDLPKALRTVGQMTTKVRRLAAEFQGQFNEAMREAELHEVRREVEGLKGQIAATTSGAFNPIQTIRDELKGAIDKPASAAPALYEPTPPVTYETTDISNLDGSGAAAQPVEEAGPIHHIEPVPETVAPPPPPPHSEPLTEPAGPGLEGPNEIAIPHQGDRA